MKRMIAERHVRNSASLRLEFGLALLLLATQAAMTVEYVREKARFVSAGFSRPAGAGAAVRNA